MSAEASGKSPLRALVVGAGPTAALWHLPALAALRDDGHLVLVLVCDLDDSRAEAARRRFGFEGQTSDAVTALERPDIDIVYVFGSAQLHHAYGLIALQNGKHLFVEKPVAPSYAEAREMVRTAAERGLVAVGGHNRRFYKSLQTIREAAGTAGWRSAEASFHKPQSRKPAPFGGRTWLSANGIHALDALIFMMGGVPDQITAFAHGSGKAVPSIFSAVMRWPDGAQGAFLCNNNAGARREAYVFHAPGQTCSATDSELLVEKDGLVTRTAISSVGDGLAQEHEAFLDAIARNAQPPHAIAAIAPSLFVCELIESGYSGRVRLPPEEPARATGPSPAARSILVARPESLLPALADLAPQYRLVSLEEVQRSGRDHPEIEAAILGQGAPPLASDILDRLPRLSVVGVAGLSVARYEPEALLARGVAIMNASQAYAESVAEFALGLAILGRRRAFASHEVMRRGGWGDDLRATGVGGFGRRAARAVRPGLAAFGLESSLRRLWRMAAPQPPGPTRAGELRGCTVGLVGWGANARAFTDRLRLAGAEVLVYSGHASAEEIKAGGGAPASLAEVLAADIVSLHRGLSPATKHSLAAAELARVRPGAVLINVARGALVEPSALLARLKKGDVFACLDTFEEEPLRASDPLRRLPNVFLTSHIAGGSPAMHAAAAEEVVLKVIAALDERSGDHIRAERLRTMT